MAETLPEWSRRSSSGRGREILRSPVCHAGDREFMPRRPRHYWRGFGLYGQARIFIWSRIVHVPLRHHQASQPPPYYLQGDKRGYIQHPLIALLLWSSGAKHSSERFSFLSSPLTNFSTVKGKIASTSCRWFPRRAIWWGIFVVLRCVIVVAWVGIICRERSESQNKERCPLFLFKPPGQSWPMRL